MPRYITHARDTRELLAEFQSDITRRLDTLDGILKTMKPNAAESSRISRARRELLDLQDYWRNIEIGGDRE